MSATHSNARKFVIAGSVAFLVIAGWTGTSLFGPSLDAAPDQGMSAQTLDALRHAQNLSAAFKYAARQVAPSVVHVTSTQTIQSAGAFSEGGQGNSPNDEFFRRFFGDQLPDGFQFHFGPGQGATPEPFERSGTGAGLIIRDDGYIVTNNHVVEDATEISVKLDDNREFEATVVGTDPESDLAVIRIDASSLPAAQFGNSEGLETGEWVLAIGNPFGYDQTVTSGIISATGRGAIGPAVFANFIQTDAAINPGNSGGPLLTLDGKVIGINTLIATGTGSYSGLGFAIPAALVKDVTEKIIANGKVTRGWLGIQMQPLDPTLAESFGFKGDTGVLVGRVDADSPAEKAGLKNGDIITAVNANAVRNIDELRAAVGGEAPGATVPFSVFRNGSRLTINVTLGERDIKQIAQQSAPGIVTPEHVDEFGLTVQTLNDNFARQLGMPGAQGVVVTQVKRGSRAAKAGMQARDVIDQVGDTVITNADEFAAAIDQFGEGDQIRLHVLSQGAARYVIMQPAKK